MATTRTSTEAALSAAPMMTAVVGPVGLQAGHLVGRQDLT